MAKVYAAPKGMEPPKFEDYQDARGRWDFKAHQVAEDAYLKRLQAYCREQFPGDKYAGELYMAGVADGNAVYVVLRSRPLELFHVEIGDAYMLPAPHERGLRLSDIKAHIEWEKKWKTLGKKSAV